MFTSLHNLGQQTIFLLGTHDATFTYIHLTHHLTMSSCIMRMYVWQSHRTNTWPLVPNIARWFKVDISAPRSTLRYKQKRGHGAMAGDTHHDYLLRNCQFGRHGANAVPPQFNRKAVSLCKGCKSTVAPLSSFSSLSQPDFDLSATQRSGSCQTFRDGYHLIAA